MSSSKEMDKEDVVHIYKGILLSYKKEQNNAICNNMHGPINYHIKRIVRQRNQISYYITHMWNLIFKMIQMYLFTKQKQT